MPTRCSKAVWKPVWHIPVPNVQLINSWWWTDELSETCRVSCQNKFVKLVHLVGFITHKFVTMRGHMSHCSHMSRCTVTYHDARSYVTMHGHISRCTVTCHDAVTCHIAVTCHDAQSHVTMHGHMSRCSYMSHCSHMSRCTVIRKYKVCLFVSLHFNF